MFMRTNYTSSKSKWFKVTRRFVERKILCFPYHCNFYCFMGKRTKSLLENWAKLGESRRNNNVYTTQCRVDNLPLSQLVFTKNNNNFGEVGSPTTRLIRPFSLVSWASMLLGTWSWRNVPLLPVPSLRSHDQDCRPRYHWRRPWIQNRASPACYLLFPGNSTNRLIWLTYCLGRKRGTPWNYSLSFRFQTDHNTV